MQKSLYALCIDVARENFLYQKIPAVLRKHIKSPYECELTEYDEQFVREFSKLYTQYRVSHGRYEITIEGKTNGLGEFNDMKFTYCPSTKDFRIVSLFAYMSNQYIRYQYTKIYIHNFQRAYREEDSPISTNFHFTSRWTNLRTIRYECKHVGSKTIDYWDKPDYRIFEDYPPLILIRTYMKATGRDDINPYAYCPSM